MKRTALVTGANRGIGLEIAHQLVLKGYKVLLGVRTEESMSFMIEKGIDAVMLNLADPLTIQTQIDRITSDHGEIDILVNNAAILDSRKGLELSLEDFMNSIKVNTVAPFTLINLLAPGMLKRGWGRIVNVSSGWGSFSENMGGPTAYAVSKAALNALTLSFSRELGEAVKINAVCPGWVKTRMGGEGATNSVEEGADTPVWLATLPDDGPTGVFFRNRKEVAW